MKIKITHFIFIVLNISLIQVSQAAAQKRVPTPLGIVPTDTTVTQENPPENAATPLPSLELKEYTIVGKERIQTLPSQRTDVEILDITAREKLVEIENREAYDTPGAGGEKSGSAFDVPVAGVINELYGSFGRYSDVNAGLKLRKKFLDEEFFGDLNFRRSDGHIVNSEYYDFTGNIANVHNVSEGMDNRTEVTFNAHEYKLYGSLNSIEERQGYDVDVSSVFPISSIEPVDVRIEIGGRYNDPDKTKIFNWNLRSRINVDAIAYSTLISGSIEWNADRVKDGDHDNAPINETNFARAQLTFSRLIGERLHVRAGGSFYWYGSDSAEPVITILNDTIIDINERVLVDREDSKVYPIASLTLDLEEAGRLFVEYEPGVESVTLLSKLKSIPYLDIATPLSHEETSQNLKIGWRRSYAYDLSFELYYNDKRINNYGYLFESGLGLGTLHNGKWTYIYNNNLTINEYSGLVNWSPDPRFNAWISGKFLDIAVVKSEFSDNVPYLPDLVFDYSMHYTPGYGFQIIFDGQYVGKRYAHPINYENSKLDGYFLANVTVSKRWSRFLGSYAYISNLFDEEYEIWNNYLAPDFNGGAGLRFFW
jgi:outer membrane receptor protein involved in Fe transport